MNTAILSSTIGGSAILIAAMVGALMNHILSLQRQNLAKMEAGFQLVTAAINGLDTKFTGQINGLDTKFTGQINGLDTKFTGQINGLAGEIKDLEIRLTDKFTRQIAEQIDGVRGHLADLRKEVHDGFKAHGERLARIEVELKISPPPAEAP